MSEGSIILISWNAAANALQKRHFGKKPLAQPFFGSAEEFCAGTIIVDGAHSFIVDPPLACVFDATDFFSDDIMVTLPPLT